MQTAHAPAAARNKPGAGAVSRGGTSDPRAEAEYRRGLDLGARDQWVQAERCFARAVRHSPGDAVLWLNLANARVRCGSPDAAIEAARRALELDPQSPLAVTIATQCLAASNRHAECVELLRGLDLDAVRDPGPHFALADALAALGQVHEAVGSYLAALQRKPDFIPAHIHLGNTFERAGLHEEARECYLTALELGGSAPELTAAMAYQSLHACRWETYATDRARLQALLDGGAVRVMPFHLLALSSTRQEQLRCARAYWSERSAGIAALPPAPPRRAGAPLRVGYVSNDLHQHATAYLIADLLERHDRSRFGIHVYSFGVDDGSATRQRLRAAAGEHFVEAAGMSDRALAERVRADDIDILVDLKGHTHGARPRIFAYRAARIQVNYLGYPGTVGSNAHDYLIGDPIVTPMEHAADYSEKLAQLPDCYQPNDRNRAIGPRPSRGACGLPEEGFVFCSFNNCYKITAPVFERWCELLRAVPGSVLWLYAANAQAHRSLEREAARRGIDPGRLVWAPHLAQAEHLGRLQLADLALDTWPVNSHTTASDALWAGVPLVTAAGDTFVARVAASVLHAAGMDELVAADADAAHALALALARDPPRLAGVRARVAAQRMTCALFDSARHTRALERLYERMLERWSRGGRPQALPAEGATP